MSNSTVPGMSGEFQMIVAALMRTLLEEHPTLLEKSEMLNLMDAESCKKKLGLRIANHALLRHRDDGRMIQGYGRYWERVYADEYLVCSQWQKQYHEVNADALSKFVSELAERRPEDAGSSKLFEYAEAFNDFRDRIGKADSTDSSARKKIAGWPRWSSPDDENSLELARAMTPFVRFLDRDIVAAVVEDNRRNADTWSFRLESLNIEPEIYLWEGSPCAFPGVRRYAGSTEIAVFRRRIIANDVPPHCIALDDNDYPKHLWAFVFTGKPFRKRGPSDYQLAHLLDHKEYGNRWHDELDNRTGTNELKPYGLFTSAANTAYVPSAFLRPTDFSPKLRSLIQRRAEQLYGGICNIVPTSLALKPCDDSNWSLENFQWGAPVGNMDNICDFLQFRHERMQNLFELRHAALRID